jgi:hypothetical protein
MVRGVPVPDPARSGRHRTAGAEGDATASTPAMAGRHFAVTATFITRNLLISVRARGG